VGGRNNRRFGEELSSGKPFSTAPQTENDCDKLDESSESSESESQESVAQPAPVNDEWPLQQQVFALQRQVQLKDAQLKRKAEDEVQAKVASLEREIEALKRGPVESSTSNETMMNFAAMASGLGRASSNRVVEKLIYPRGVTGSAYFDIVTAQLAKIRTQLTNHPLYDHQSGRRDRYRQLLDEDSEAAIRLRMNSTVDFDWRSRMDTCGTDEFMRLLEKGMMVDLPKLDVSTKTFPETLLALLRTFSSPFANSIAMTEIFTKIMILAERYNYQADYIERPPEEDGAPDRLNVRNFDSTKPLIFTTIHS